MRSLTIALDVDDTLMEFTSILCDEMNKQNYTKGLTANDITKWNFVDFPNDLQEAFCKIIATDIVHDRQVPMKGSCEMIRELLKRGHDPVFVSAVDPIKMTKRAIQVANHFPEVPKQNILLGARKDLVRCDVLLDDAVHNIRSSQARYPILYRRPWNQDQKGVLSVTNYEEFLDLVDQIANEKSVRQPDILCLVGPSGSGKTFITEALCQDPRYSKVRSSTSRARREDDRADSYYFLSRKEFEQALARSEFVEHNENYGNLYGVSKTAIQDVLDKGKVAVVPIEINGATNLRAAFGERVATVFINRNREQVVQAILERNSAVTDKVTRIVSLDDEYDNKNKCQWVVYNDGSIDNTLSQLKKIA